MTITSRQNPLVARYRAAARGQPGDAMLLDGVHLVSEAMRASVTISHAAATAAAATDAEVRDVVAALDRAGIDVVAVSDSVMDAISPVRSSSGLVALAARPDAPVANVFARTPPLVVIGVDIQDPGNLGAIVRVVEAGGATGMLAAGASADPFGWKALRGSMGSALRVPIASASADESLAEARRHGCRIVATVPRDGVSLFEADLAGPLAIVIGGEGSGLPAAIVDAADERVSIPMAAPVESLNAAVTAALVVYEARRRG